MPPRTLEKSTMNPQIIEEQALTMAEVKEHLAKIKKRDEELNFRANKTEENLNTVVEIKPAKAKELKEKLEELSIPRLKDVHICKICDILPDTVDELKVVLQGYTITVTNDNMKKIIDVVKNYT